MKSLCSVIMLVATISVFTSCKKDNTNNDSQPGEPVKEIKIGAQSLEQVKATFQGRWKLNYTLGGYTGRIKVTYPNTVLQFTNTDSLYRWDNDVQTINSRMTYNFSNTYIDNYFTYMLVIEKPRNMMVNEQIAYARKGDTLIVIEPISHPEKYFLTKF